MDFTLSSQCQMCKTTVKLCDLRQCIGDISQPHYCIKNCRFCRTSDFEGTTCTNKIGHVTCWTRHLPQEEDEENLHQPLDPLQKLYLDAVTYSANEETQERLHQEDRIAEWFTIKTDEKETRIKVTDRFRHLCNPGSLPNEYCSRQFPGFVSFIGATGRGKSTLMKAMILMGYLDPSGTHFRSDEDRLEERIIGLRNAISQKAFGPVSKSGSVDHMTDPTSFGVHLYRDIALPGSNEDDSNRAIRDTPILFADCEGFRAGSALTNAQRAYVRQCSSTERTSSSNLIIDSPITAESYGKDGKEGIDLFYARFLYTVSDVVVLIISGDSEVFSDIQRVVEWAATAVYQSVNHLAQKTLIIVRNKETFDHVDLYEAKSLKENLLKNQRPFWTGSALLERFRNDYNSKQTKYDHKIHDNHDLLRKFFSKVRACNIPHTKTTSLQKSFRQYQDLRYQIIDASQKSQSLRAKNCMQYNVPMLSHILNNAFEHFRTSDEPFDFYKAARHDNPNPISVPGHIANFIRHLSSLGQFPPNMTSEVIAFSLVTWTLRSFGLVRDPDEIFDRDLKQWCREGMQKYAEEYQQCGSRSGKDGGQCIKKRPTHEFEHCDEKGNRTPGIFDDSRRLSLDTISLIHNSFINQYWELCASKDGVFTLPTPEQAKRQREVNMQPYKNWWKHLRSNKTCFGCLQEVPDHMLECGHAFCAQCVQELGKRSEYYELGWVVNSCNLCQSSWQDGRHYFLLHPICAGVRALTLDGGGIRGIVEISLLEKVCASIDLELHLRDCFDIIVGTSTGGIIGLGLATLPRDKSISDLKEKFLVLAKRTFEGKRGGIVLKQLDYFKLTTAAFLCLRIWDSVYKTAPLRESLKELFGANAKLFSSAHRDIRVAVTAAKDNGADKCLITNYNRPAYADQNTDFEREDNENNELAIWEAGLATSAAPFYFQKFEKQETKKNYCDGALHSNFPVQYTLDEICRIWNYPGEEKPPIDILLTVGAGQQNREIKIPVPLRIGGFDAVCTSFHNNLDSHRQWAEFERVHLDTTQLGNVVHRLNAQIKGKYVALDDYKRMPEIDKDIQVQVEEPDFAARIDGIAALLIANLFFFEPHPMYRDRNSSNSRQNYYIPGSIRCRLARESTPLKNLVDVIDSFWYKEIRTEADLSNERPWKKISFSDQERRRVRTQRAWLRIEHNITPVEQQNTRQVLAVTLKRRGDEKKVPISGFPVEWRILQQRARR